MEKNWERINEENLKRLVEESEGWDKEEWRTILVHAPIDGLFYALMRQITKTMDTIRRYESVKDDIDKVYSDEFDW